MVLYFYLVTILLLVCRGEHSGEQVADAALIAKETQKEAGTAEMEINDLVEEKPEEVMEGDENLYANKDETILPEEEDFNPLLEDDTNHQDWVLGVTMPLNRNQDIGRTRFNNLFHSGEHQIIKRVCSNCINSHKIIYYRRLNKDKSFDAWNNMRTTWTNHKNRLNHEFMLTSSLTDAIQKKNGWKFCNYNDRGIGSFRDCGPRVYVPHQWVCSRNRNCGKHAKFYIYVKKAKCSALNIDYFLDHCSKYDFTKHLKHTADNKKAIQQNHQAIMNVDKKLTKLMNDLKGDKASETQSSNMVLFKLFGSDVDIWPVLFFSLLFFGLFYKFIYGKYCCKSGKEMNNNGSYYQALPNTTEITQLVEN